MIRCAWNEAKALADIAALDANWIQKAATRTAALTAAGRFNETSSIWSTVKEVFMRLQLDKCAFCERQFENPDYGRIEFDLEHFRPKSAVDAWPDAKLHPTLSYAFPTGIAGAGGYYWLAYELSNYAASCKVCNSTFKSSYFPIAGDRCTAPSGDLTSEAPYLCYPIGDGDTDPEKLIGFVATTAVPVGKTKAAKLRGRVIIDFFGLNARLQLHRERARMIALFGGALAARHDARATPTDLLLLGKLKAANLPHANCLRSFERLWRRDPAQARQTYDACVAYAVSDGTSPPQVP